MTGMNSQWTEVGKVQDIPKRGSRCIRMGETTIALFRSADDQVYAMEDKCPHKKGPLSQGIVHDNCVTCPLHNWVISLETGLAQGADSGSVMTFPVKEEAGVLFLSLKAAKEVAA